jgi:hypothetical protein
MQHKPCLGCSAHFSRYTVRKFRVDFTCDFESVLGCVYFVVNASKSELGERARAFEAELFETLARSQPFKIVP